MTNANEYDLLFCQISNMLVAKTHELKVWKEEV